MKKLLALTFVLAIAVPAFAADSDAASDRIERWKQERMDSVRESLMFSAFSDGAPGEDATVQGASGERLIIGQDRQKAERTGLGFSERFPWGGGTAGPSQPGSGETQQTDSDTPQERSDSDWWWGWWWWHNNGDDYGDDDDDDDDDDGDDDDDRDRWRWWHHDDDDDESPSHPH